MKAYDYFFLGPIHSIKTYHMTQLKNKTKWANLTFMAWLVDQQSFHSKILLQSIKSAVEFFKNMEISKERIISSHVFVQKDNVGNFTLQYSRLTSCFVLKDLEHKSEKRKYFSLSFLSIPREVIFLFV